MTEVNEVNAEAISAISKADFKSKSYIALKEARESLSWLELLHHNNYLTDVEFQSLHDDCEELSILNYSKSGVYHFSNEGVCSWYDFTKMIQQIAVELETPETSETFGTHGA